MRLARHIKQRSVCLYDRTTHNIASCTHSKNNGFLPLIWIGRRMCHITTTIVFHYDNTFLRLSAVIWSLAGGYTLTHYAFNLPIILPLCPPVMPIYAFEVNLLFSNYAQKMFCTQTKFLLYWTWQKQKYKLLEMIAAHD